MNATPYVIVFARSAATAIAEQLPESVASAVLELISGDLAAVPRRVGTPLGDELEGRWAARRGTYRIVYRIDDVQREVLILRVAHRRDAYRRLDT